MKDGLRVIVEVVMGILNELYDTTKPSFKHI